MSGSAVAWRVSVVLDGFKGSFAPRLTSAGSVYSLRKEDTQRVFEGGYRCVREIQGYRVCKWKMCFHIRFRQ